jgi:hypothetical protein
MGDNKRRIYKYYYNADYYVEDRETKKKVI